MMDTPLILNQRGSFLYVHYLKVIRIIYIIHPDIIMHGANPLIMHIRLVPTPNRLNLRIHAITANTNEASIIVCGLRACLARQIIITNPVIQPTANVLITSDMTAHLLIMKNRDITIHMKGIRNLATCITVSVTVGEGIIS